MVSRWTSRSTVPAVGLLVLALSTLSWLTAACSSSADAPAMPVETAEGPSAPGDVWPTLLRQTPYPYTTPLPPARASTLDAVYTNFDPKEGTRPFCRRCMPYPAEGGIWMLQLEQGIYRIFSARSLTGWHSLGSFTLSHDRLMLFNDPHCIDDVGVYSWKLEAGQLVLEAMADECADGWRAIILTNYPWTRAAS